MEAPPRRLQRLHVLICLAGLALYVPGFVQQVVQPALPPDLDRDALSYPVRLQSFEAADPEQLRFFGEGWSIGSRLTLREADGRSRTVELVARHDRSYLALAAFGALFFWAMCLFAFTPRLAAPGALYSFWMTFPYGLAVASGGIYFRGDRPWLWSVPGHFHLLCLAALPVVFVAMTTSFPRRHPVRDRAPWLLPLLAALAAVLALWQIVGFELFFRDPQPSRGAGLALSGRVADLAIVAQALLGVVFLVQQGRSARRTREREAVLWLFRGFLVGATPYVFLRSLPVALGLPALVPASVDRLFELVIPITFLLVVVRYQFLDIDVILRRGLIYGTVATIFLAASTALVVLVHPFLTALLPESGPLLSVALGIGVGLLFRPVRSAVARWADRRFFRILVARDGLLGELERALALTVTTETALDVLARQLERALEPTRLAIIVKRTDGILARNGPGDATSILTAWENSACREAPVVAAPRSTDHRELESEHFPEVLRQRFVLAAPLRAGEDGGVVLIGGRRSQRHYIRQELRLLRDVAHRASIHLERIELARRIHEEQAESRRQQAAHRAKSEFLARVSHDLRTPLTSISWSVQNLLDGVVGELTPRQREYLDEVRHSGDYLNRLVTKLLSMSRLERGEMEAHCAQTDVRAVVERSVRTVGAVARTGDVRVGASLGDEPTNAWVDPHLLEEALVNLLENAVEFSPPGETVDVSLESGDHTASIRVRDHGPGLPEGEAAAIFDRFARGPHSPWSRREGFGLGLYIARLHLELMHGSLEAKDHAEGGALFTCVLATEAPGEET